MPEYTFEKIINHKDEIDNWFKLFDACFGVRESLDTNWYYWSHVSYRENNTFVVRDEDSGDIMASYSLYPVKIKYKSNLRDGYLCHNVMTHPSMAGRGLFTELGRYALSNMPKDSIFLGVPNEKAIRGHLKVGWREYPNIPFYIKRNFNHQSEVNKDVVKIDKFDFSNDDINKFNNSYDFCLYKDSKCLNWRYVDRPDMEYMCYKLLDNSGFIVLKHYNTKLHIMDYGFANKKSFVKLVKFTENKALELNCDIIEFWCYSRTDQDVLNQLGFGKSDQLHNRLILSANPLIDLNLNNNWKIVLGDNDVY
jgi:GNAT superfamily N-acetyltransferase